MKIGASSSKKLKQRRKTPKTKLEDKIHSVMREIAIVRSKSKCVCCGASEGAILQGGHVITRKRQSTRFDLINVHTQCSKCNGNHRYNPQIYFNWFINEYGSEEFNYLVERSQTTKQWKVYELEEMLHEYEKVLNELKHGSEFYEDNYYSNLFEV